MVRLLKSPRWFLTLAVAALAVPAYAADKADAYLPDDTEAVMTLNVRQILDSPLIKKHALELIKGVMQGNEELQKVLQSLGLDPLKDVNTLTLAGPGGTAEDNKGLMIVHGKFDLDKFHAKAEDVAKNQDDVLKIHTEGGHTIYEVTPPQSKDGKPGFVALLDDHTIVAAGNKEYVVEALDKKAGKKTATVGKEIQALLDKVDSDQSLSFVALGSVLGKGPLGSNDEVKDIVKKITTIVGGFTISDEFKLQVDIGAKDADAAQALSKELKTNLEKAKGLVAFFAADKKEMAPLADALESLKVSAKGKNVSIKGEVTSEQIDKALNRKGQ